MDYSDQKPDPYQIQKYISLEQSVPGQGYIWATKHNVEAVKDGDYSRLRPVAAEFDLSTRCLYSCPWCAYRESKAEGIIMRDDQTADAERVVEELGKAGVRLLVLTGGGEPLLAGYRKHTVSLEHIVREARRRCMYVTLYTNGFLLKRKRSDELLASDISEIRISLNDVSSQAAYKEVHGKIGSNLSVAKITDNLLYLLRARLDAKNKPRVGVSFVLVNSSAQNLAQSLSALESKLKDAGLSLDYTLIRPAINYWPSDRADYNKDLTNPHDALKKAEAVQVTFSTLGLLGTILISPSRFNDMYEEEKSGPKYPKCLAFNTWMNIGPDMTAYLCCETKHMREFKLGSVLDASIDNLLNSDVAKYMRETPDSTSKCPNRLRCPTRLCKPSVQNIIFNKIESLRDKRTGILPEAVIHWLDAMNYWAERTSQDGIITSVSGQYK
jgi:MoaA/NifB/PqqE/SkfB family radical SAM enzyme